MAANWNPNSPDVVGLEFFPYRVRPVALNTFGNAAGALLESSVAETVDTIDFYLDQVRGRNPGDGDGLYLCEVFANGSQGCVGSDIERFAPNEDEATSGVVNQAAAAVNLYQSIDETPNTAPTLTDYLTGSAASGVQKTYSMHFATAAWAALQRVVDIRFVFRLRCADTQGMGVQVYMEDNSTNAVAYYENIIAPGSGYETISVSLGDIQPLISLPWSRDEVRDFDAAAGLDIEMGFTDTGGADKFFLYQAWLEIDYVVENRLAVGSFVPVADGWCSFPLFDAQTNGYAANWSKAGAGNEYLITLRRWGFSPNASLRWAMPDSPFDTRSMVTAGYTGSETASLDTRNGMATCLADENVDNTRLAAIMVHNTTPADSDDSQSYVWIGVEDCDPANDIQQDITAASTDSFAWITAMVALNPEYVGTPGNLTIGCRRRSDDVAFGGTLVIAPSDLDALTGYYSPVPDEPSVPPQWITTSMLVALTSPLTFYKVTGALSAAAALINTTQYYLEFDGLGWLVAYLQTDGIGNALTFGGTTDASWSFVTPNPANDLATTLATLPDGPADLTATIASQAIDANGADCFADELEYVQLDWTVSAEGASFGYYQVQYSIDGGDWTDIGTCTDESVATWDYYDLPRGVSIEFRIRTVRDPDGSASAWSTSDAVTPVGDDCALSFTSSQDPTLNVAYADASASEFNFLSADQIALLPPYQRDGWIAVVGSEDRLDELTLTLITRVGIIGVTGHGRQVFNPILAIANDSTLPYVCIADHEGNFWFAQMKVRTGSRKLGTYYTASVTAIELTRTPYIYDFTP